MFALLCGTFFGRERQDIKRKGKEEIILLRNTKYDCELYILGVVSFEYKLSWDYLL